MAARPEVTGKSINRAAFSIDQFCEMHGFSRATYYNLRADGEGPDEMHIRGRILITAEAAARWRKRRTVRARAATTPVAEAS